VEAHEESEMYEPQEPEELEVEAEPLLLQFSLRLICEQQKPLLLAYEELVVHHKQETHQMVMVAQMLQEVHFELGFLLEVEVEE